ncbi:MAG: DUF4013 domain-containing protein [Anaerolineaceae bacterium]|nr:DUF4013 domain-containing protein [Anaerolineaceae bacterium]
MNFSKSFSYIFDDPDWLNKLILPLLCSLIPFIGGFVLSGYLIRLIKNVQNHEAMPLPSLDFGADLAKGFQWFVVTLVYSLPFIVLSLFVGMIIFASSEKAPALSVIFGILLAIWLLAYGIFIWLIMPIAMARFAEQGTISSGLEFTKFTKIFSKNSSEWLTVLGGGIVAGFIAPLGGIFFGIGAIVTAFYASLMVSHLTGQAYAISKEGGPYNVKPLPFNPQAPYGQPYTQPYQPIVNQAPVVQPEAYYQPVQPQVYGQAAQPQPVQPQQPIEPQPGNLAEPKPEGQETDIPLP